MLLISKKRIVLLGLLLLVICAHVIYVFATPMTISLTFDDGIRSHMTIGARMLEERGWVGAFNVITGFADGLLVSSEGKSLRGCSFLTWDELRVMHRKGHEIFPHSVTHTRLDSFETCETYTNLYAEIVSSAFRVREEIGEMPAYFCAPGNYFSAQSLRILGDVGVMPLSWRRYNFGGGSGSVSDFVRHKRLLGFKHIDLMFHGLDPDGGGWLPFKSASDFELLLNELKALERNGEIRVVPYSLGHSNNHVWQSFVCFLYDSVTRTKDMMKYYVVSPKSF